MAMIGDWLILSVTKHNLNLSTTDFLMSICMYKATVSDKLQLYFLRWRFKIGPLSPSSGKNKNKPMEPSRQS
jgi:hypothetical protein